MTELLPWLNTLLLPVLGYLVSIDRRLTRLEALREADDRKTRHLAPGRA